MNKYMRIIVFFDLPVKTPIERKEATKFRNFLLKDGYFMIQYSVYTRICNGVDDVQKHKARLENNKPNNGSIRVLCITEKQYERMELIVGEYVPEEKMKVFEQLSIF